jgi:hypothetical protein
MNKGDRTSQHSNDGEAGPSAGGGASYLGRTRAKASLSHIDSWEGGEVNQSGGAPLLLLL